MVPDLRRYGTVRTLALDGAGRMNWVAMWDTSHSGDGAVSANDGAVGAVEDRGEHNHLRGGRKGDPLTRCQSQTIPRTVFCSGPLQYRAVPGNCATIFPMANRREILPEF